jgi:hypothetical protein
LNAAISVTNVSPSFAIDGERRRDIMRIGRLALCAAIVGAGTLVSIADDIRTAPAAHAACYGSVSTMKGKNNTCSSARHWNAIKNSASKYGAWVEKGKWSEQKYCWANVVSVGMTAK